QAERVASRGALRVPCAHTAARRLGADDRLVPVAGPRTRRETLRRRSGDASRFRLGVAVLVVALTVVTLLVRLPKAISGLNGQAQRNDAYSADGRILAAADSLDVDNEFALAALSVLPERTTFAVL